MHRSTRRLIEGPGGPIEVALDIPPQPSRGLAFIGHPHPLYGGTLENKVAATLARTFVALGWLAVRPNFRGVGASAGTHDHGIGETEDFLFLTEAVPRWLANGAERDTTAGAKVALAGFSFGTFVAARAAQRLAEQHRAPDHLILVGCAAGKWDMPPVPSSTLVIHGEHDETIPLADVLDWARPQELPIVVLPGADHFFHRRLAPIKRLVHVHVSGAEALAGEGA